ncbi:MAG TPA: nuclear transport factor 2 family protein [Burkholderiales bacterium]|jgi:hypothetical protein|nr:nuclear transport factor 2 family protein [Burkholderiales bacterium]
MKSIAKVFAFALSLALSVQVYAQEITEASAKEFLRKVDKAIASKDAAAFEKYISENADISGTITTSGQTQSFKFNKAQYMAALRDTWTQASNYTYRRSNEKIVLSGAKATVTADVAESMVLQGQHVSAKSKEVGTLEKVNGVLMFTKVVAQSTM